MVLPSVETLELLARILSPVVILIAIYKFLIQRQRLQLIAEHDRDFFYDDLVRTNLRFVLSNRGFRFAEDVYLEIYLPDWNFGEPRRNTGIGVTVSTVVEGERQVDETFGAHHDPSEEDPS